MIYDIKLYPFANGEMDPDEYVESIANELYDTYVCDYRLNPEDVKKLVDIAVRIRKHKQT